MKEWVVLRWSVPLSPMATNQLLRPADLLHSFPKTDPLNRWQVHGVADAMVPMRDGVRLATDIWRPAHGDGSPVSFPVPVLLVRTSYDKQNPEWDDVIPSLVRRGIAVATVMRVSTASGSAGVPPGGCRAAHARARPGAAVAAAARAVGASAARLHHAFTRQHARCVDV